MHWDFFIRKEALVLKEMFSELKTLKRSASDSEKSSRYIAVQNMLEGAFWLAAQTPHPFAI